MTKNWISIATVLVIIATGVLFLSTKRGQNTPPIPSPTPSISNITATETPEASKSTTITPMQDSQSELKIEDLKVGTGAVAVAGKKVTVNYKGTLVNGTVFDSSYTRNQPFSFNLGAGMVIAGWDQGVVGMKIGGKRKLTIPPSLGYGSRNMGTIPPNSILIFEVELLKVE